MLEKDKYRNAPFKIKLFKSVFSNDKGVLTDCQKQLKTMIILFLTNSSMIFTTNGKY